MSGKGCLYSVGHKLRDKSKNKRQITSAILANNGLVNFWVIANKSKREHLCRFKQLKMSKNTSSNNIKEYPLKKCLRIPPQIMSKNTTSNNV